MYRSFLPAGTYTTRYSAIAATRGEFLLPSTKVYLLLEPEIFGLSKSGLLVVEDEEGDESKLDYEKLCLHVNREHIAYVNPKPDGGFKSIIQESAPPPFTNTHPSPSPSHFPQISAGTMFIGMLIVLFGSATASFLYACLSSEPQKADADIPLVMSISDK
jgi:hypothetical protein